VPRTIRASGYREGRRAHESRPERILRARNDLQGPARSESEKRASDMAGGPGLVRLRALDELGASEGLADERLEMRERQRVVVGIERELIPLVRELLGQREFV